METKLISYSKNYVPSLPHNRHAQKRLNHTPILAVLTNHPGNISRFTEESIPKPGDYNLPGSTTKTVYNDSWFDRLAINHLSQCVQAATGLKNEKTGYESLVQATMDVAHKFSISQQRDLVLQALDRAFPRPILYLIRTALPASKFTRGYFAAFTTLFFPWLIGPCEVRESVLNGSKEKHVVHIKKCRFLEQSNCAGMCTNLCKIPSQVFIKESLGMPVNMVPNFEDMSCEMIFGQEPPPLSEDPALSQPCYKLCKVNQRPKIKCPT